jgi:hypothetical protein
MITRQNRIFNAADFDIGDGWQDGYVPVYNGASSYIASLSPLRWNGNDYKQPNLGGLVTPCIVYLMSQTPGFIEADGGVFLREGTTNIHVGLVHWTDGSRTTLYVGDGIATTKSGLETIIQGAVDATATVDNFKANYFTYHAGADYTFNGLTGFDVAGAVTVVSGGNASPAITYVAPLNKLQPGPNWAPKHFACGIFASRGDTAQAVANNSATVINLDTDTLFTDEYFETDNSTHGFFLGAHTVTGARGIIVLKDDSNALIPTAVIELQKQNQDTSWTTQYAGLGGSLSFPFEYGDGENNVTFRVRVTQTSGSSKNVYCELHIYRDE